MRLKKLVGTNPDGSPILEDRTPEETARMLADAAPVSQREYKALLALLDGKGVVTKAEVDAERSKP